MTVKKARVEIGRALSQADSTEQLRMLNLIRSYLYANQRKLGLNLSTPLCVQVGCFCTECPDRCEGDMHRGFRLPSRFQSLESAVINKRHVPVFSHWRLPFDNVSGFPGDGKAKLFDAGTNPLERDFTNCHPTALRIVSEKYAAEQTMAVTGTTLEGREETFDYKVTLVAQITNEVFKSISHVTFEDGVKGRVILSEPDGRELARYHCGQTVPQFREYRLVKGCCPDGCCPESVIVIANATYEDVYDDLDIVEHGNPLVWKLLAKFMRLVDKDDKDSNDRANMTDYLNLATSLMVEQSTVEDGENTDFRFRRAPIKGGRLGNRFYGARRQ